MASKEKKSGSTQKTKVSAKKKTKEPPKKKLTLAEK